MAFGVRNSLFLAIWAGVRKKSSTLLNYPAFEGTSFTKQMLLQK
jgi:hypothetical protein